MKKGSILREHNIIFNVYEPNNRVINNTRQKLIELQEEIDGPTIIAGDVNTPLSVIAADRKSAGV